MNTLVRCGFALFEIRVRPAITAATRRRPPRDGI